MLQQEANGSSNPSESNPSEAAPDQPQSDMQVNADSSAGTDANAGNGEAKESDVKETNDQSNDNSAEDKKEDHFAVFVRNLPFSATEDAVRKHFEKTCKVKKVTLNLNNGKFRGRATVELVDRDSYKEAKKLIGSIMEGRALYVVAHSSMKPGEDSEEEEKATYRAIVRNIPDSVTVLEAKRHFYSAGLIRRFVVKRGEYKNSRDSSRHNGTAILKVDKLEAFVNVLKMDGSILGGVPISVDPLGGSDFEESSTFKRSSESGDSRDTPAKRQKKQQEMLEDVENALTVFVANLPYLVSRDEIIKHFEQAGPVVFCKIPVIATAKIRRPVAFVKMADKEGHEKALKLLGSSIGDCEIHVDAVKEYNRMSKWVFCDNPPQKGKKPFLAFVGNIAYSTTIDDIWKHFQEVGEIKDIDLPTRNGLKRGLAYIQLGDQTSFEKALDMHHTTLNGRVVDVLDASHGDNLYDLPPQARKKNRGRFTLYGKGGIHELTWHKLCRP